MLRRQVVDSPNFIEQYQSRDDIFNRPDLVRESARPPSPPPFSPVRPPPPHPCTVSLRAPER